MQSDGSVYMSKNTEQITAYVPPELHEKFKQESIDIYGKNGLSKNLRRILRDHYAEQQAEAVADDMQIKSQLEAKAAQLMEDMQEHREEIDGDISLSAIYSVATFELLAAQNDVESTRKREAIQTAKQRVHTDADVDGTTDTSDDTDSDKDRSEGAVSDETDSGFDLSWRED